MTTSIHKSIEHQIIILSDNCIDNSFFPSTYVDIPKNTYFSITKYQLLEIIDSTDLII